MNQHDNLVVTIGELLIDFFCTDIDVDLIVGQHFMKEAGGAPANVSSAVAKLGGTAAFVGKVGRDPFGEFLKQTLVLQKVDTSMLVMDEAAPTTLAFVSLKANGERDFTFHRGADGLLTYEEIDVEKLKQAKIVHFGSATALLDNPFRETYLHLMSELRENGKFISFDPNYRGNLWGGKEEAFISLSRGALALADFVKVSEEELEIIARTSDREEAIQQFHGWGAKIVAVTLGKQGALLSDGKKISLIESPSVQSIDSTGAGDAFVGAMLFQLAAMEYPKEALNHPEQLKEAIRFANKAGALVCTKVGAIAALPAYEEVLGLCRGK